VPFGSAPSAARRREAAVVVYEPTHHTIVAVDVAGSGGLDDREQLRMRARLRAVVSTALPLKSLDVAAVDVADLGDGLRLICPASISPCALLDPFVGNLARALRLCREVVADGIRLRLRVAVHAGLLHRDDGGWAGEPLVHTARLLDAPPARRVLRDSESADLVVVVSQAIYDSVVRHGYGLDPATCRKVRVRVKETVADAWLHVPASGHPFGAAGDATGDAAREIVHGLLSDLSRCVPPGGVGSFPVRSGLGKLASSGGHGLGGRGTRFGPRDSVPGPTPPGPKTPRVVKPAPGTAPVMTEHRAGVAGGPTARRMLLGARLRRMREDAGITREEAGEMIHGSESKISRMERGRVGFKPHDVANLLTLYGVDDTQRAALLAQAGQANAPGWWHGYADLLPNWLQSYLDLEAAAVLIRGYEVQFVPALLQTEAYARAVIELGYGHASREEINRRVAMRMAHQRLLTRPDPPRLWVVMDEAVLRRPIGGRRVMRDQLEALMHAATCPNIQLQVAPLRAGGHATAGGAFTVLRFSDPDLPDMVFLEHLTSALYLNKREVVDQYFYAAGRLFVDAEAPTRTTDFLRTALDDLR
jgi:transcriptional regulator with XRE-family HTH domain